MRIFPFPRMQSMGIVLTCLWPPFHNMNECPLILLSTNPIQWKIHAPIIRSFTSWKTVQPLVKKSWLQPYSYAVLPLPCTFDTQHLLSQHFLSPLILFPDSALTHLLHSSHPLPPFNWLSSVKKKENTLPDLYACKDTDDSNNRKDDE